MRTGQNGPRVVGDSACCKPGAQEARTRAVRQKGLKSVEQGHLPCPQAAGRRVTVNKAPPVQGEGWMASGSAGAEQEVETNSETRMRAMENAVHNR